MSLGTQRLLRTQKLLLSRPSHPFTSSSSIRHYRVFDTVPMVVPRSEAAAAAAAPSPNGKKDSSFLASQQLPQRGENAAAGPENIEARSGRWILSPDYVVGGRLLRSKDNLDPHDEGLRPKWDERCVPLNLRRVGEEGKGLLVRLPNFWLRDNCRCTKCVNQDTMQRAFDTFDIPSNVAPREVATEREGLKIKWKDGHDSMYPWQWIFQHGTTYGREDFGPDGKKEASPYQTWGKDIEVDPPSVAYKEIMGSDKGVAKWTAQIRKFGFCYVDDCPVSPEKTQELLERIAFIRTTHYGGFYDFTADLTMKDTAYTNLALPAHTDNTYFSDPSGLQAFHLLSHTEGEGGKSLLVDGFKAAAVLLKENRKAWETLRNYPIPWHASGNDGITITPFKKFPVFEFGDLVEGRVPELVRVRWNNDDRGVVSLKSDGGNVAVDWFKAAKAWNNIMNRKDMQYWSQLKPGRPLIFDNWRVLHGRSAFTGKRRICGAYINHDDYISRWRNTNFSREEALKQIL